MSGTMSGPGSTLPARLSEDMIHSIDLSGYHGIQWQSLAHRSCQCKGHLEYPDNSIRIITPTKRFPGPGERV